MDETTVTPVAMISEELLLVNFTVALLAKLVPVIVTLVLLVLGQDDGVMLVTVGGGIVPPGTTRFAVIVESEAPIFVTRIPLSLPL